jgi:hypothetical protein
VNPLIPEGSQGHVFAIYDVNAKLQYIGFSKSLRTTLRTLLGRRPDKAHFFKCAPSRAPHVPLPAAGSRPATTWRRHALPCSFAAARWRTSLQPVGRPDPPLPLPPPHTCRATHFQALDQEAMVAAREAWYEQCGGPPPGNKLALERKLWQQPVDGGAISARGKRVRGGAWKRQGCAAAACG